MTTEHDPKDFPPAFEAEFADMDLTNVRKIVLAAWCTGHLSEKLGVARSNAISERWLWAASECDGCLDWLHDITRHVKDAKHFYEHMGQDDDE